MHLITPALPLCTVLLLVACNGKPDIVFERPTDSFTPSASSAVALPDPVSVPGSVLIRVPFTSQAPTGNWKDPYQEACEEASLLMVHHFLSGAPLGTDIADRGIVDMVRWQTEQGHGQDVNIEDLAQIARDYYGYDPQVRTDVTIESIQRLLAQGKPIIVPAAGRMLGNPYFSGEGPFYHMLVIVGYDDRDFITNDPGTRRGEGFRYRHQVLLDAIHDWTGVKENTAQGRKVMMTI